MKNTADSLNTVPPETYFIFSRNCILYRLNSIPASFLNTNVILFILSPQTATAFSPSVIFIAL